MSTALALISTALKNIGVLASNEAPSADEANDGLDRLNAMIDSWSNESLTCYAILEQSGQLAVGKGEYTIGPGGDFDTVRPIRITAGPGAAYLVDTNNNRYPVTVIPQDQWNLLWNIKSINSNLPDTMFYNPQFPLGTINIYPQPNTSNVTLFWDSYLQLAEFPDLTTDMTFPPGYKLAIETNLSVFLKPFYLTAQLDPDLREQAREAKGNIKRANIRANVAVYDRAITRGGSGRYNVYSDTSR